MCRTLEGHKLSLPSWERGLKLSYAYHYATEMAVAPLVGAWVEILNITEPQKVYMVAPLVGAWVEIWVELTIQPPSSGRSPRGSVG